MHQPSGGTRSSGDEPAQDAAAVLFASLLGYNPVQTLLGPDVLNHLSTAQQQHLTGHSFFPLLISAPFSDGLHVAFGFAICACLVAAVVSALRGGKYVHTAPSAKDEDAAPAAGFVAEPVE